ncbi:hypothetical protein [Kordiimonas aestuarii]|uniref:hypothetical protein n=1 Tax=Kordiimonas aestuarii TaxID=1005925 RepID=UPI0021CEB8C2|nr:hypothetical protein [Kordiimonas aestuarii]
MKKRLPDIMEEMRQALLGRKKDHRWGTSASEAYSAAVGGIKDFSGDTLTKTAQRFNEALPYIERAGYEVTEIEVGLGLSPKIVPHLRLRELISDEAQTALLAETRDKKLINTILGSLFRASSTRKKLKFNRFHFTDLELELSILPTVVLKFKPNENHRGDPALLEDLTSADGKESDADTPKK